MEFITPLLPVDYVDDDIIIRIDHEHFRNARDVSVDETEVGGVYVCERLCFDPLAWGGLHVHLMAYPYPEDMEAHNAQLFRKFSPQRDIKQIEQKDNIYRKYI